MVGRGGIYGDLHGDGQPIGPVPGETLDDLRVIASGLLHDGIDVSKMSNVAKAELRQAIDRILKLADVYGP